MKNLEDISEPYLPPKDRLKFGPVRELGAAPNDNVTLKPGIIVYGSPPVMNLRLLKKVHKVVEDDVVEYTGEYVESEHAKYNVAPDAIRVRSAYGDWEGWVQLKSVQKHGTLSLTVSQLICYALAIDGPSTREQLETRVNAMSDYRVHEINGRYLSPYSDRNKSGLLGKYVTRSAAGVYDLTPEGITFAQNVIDNISKTAGQHPAGLRISASD